MIYFLPFIKQAGVAELADARDSKSRTFGYVGSIPTFGMFIVCICRCRQDFLVLIVRMSYFADICSKRTEYGPAADELVPVSTRTKYSPAKALARETA